MNTVLYRVISTTNQNTQKRPDSDYILIRQQRQTMGTMRPPLPPALKATNQCQQRAQTSCNGRGALVAAVWAQISKGQFRRGLDQAGLTAPARGAPPSDLLSVKEVEMLSKRYEVKGNGHGHDPEVNYWKLCEQIEKVRGWGIWGFVEGTTTSGKLRQFLLLWWVLYL